MGQQIYPDTFLLYSITAASLETSEERFGWLIRVAWVVFLC